MKIPAANRPFQLRPSCQLEMPRTRVSRSAGGVMPQKSVCRQMCDYIPVPSLREKCKQHCPS